MKHKIYSTFTFIKRITLKSLWINFKYLKFKEAIRLPILVHKKTKFLSLKGRIELPKKLKTGMIKIGYGGAAFDYKNLPTILQIEGTLRLKGNTSFGNGSTISILNNGELTIGKNFSSGSNTKLLCRKKIEFGDDCLLSWNITIMDTDFHKIFNSHDDRHINIPSPIKIGSKVWVGCHSMILKGTTINDGNIIAANTTVSKDINENNAISASNKQTLIKSNIYWQA